MATDPFNQQLGQRVHELRTTRGWSRRQLALAVDVHPSQVTRYEAGEAAPSVQVLAGIASALNVTTDELVFGGSVDPSGGLSALFKAVAEFTPAEKKVAKAVLEALVVHHEQKKDPRKRT